jgi:ABC-type molybdate transport system permease subunit
MYNLIMRHEVPQFIDIEDKIFGPLTFKQAIYLAGSIGASFAIYFGLGKFDVPFVIRLVLIAPPVSLGIALAFVKVNRRPFINFMESFFYFTFSAKRYI